MSYPWVVAYIERLTFSTFRTIRSLLINAVLRSPGDDNERTVIVECEVDEHFDAFLQHQATNRKRNRIPGEVAVIQRSTMLGTFRSSLELGGCFQVTYACLPHHDTISKVM